VTAATSPSEALCTANGIPIAEATIHIPRSGVWHADLAVVTDTPADVTGVIALSILGGQLLMNGSSCTTPLSWRGVTRLRMAAGAAGLGTKLTAQGYSSAPASVIVGDILTGAVGSTGASETLSSTSMSLGARMNWCRLAPPEGGASAGTALRAIVLELGAVWRALPDGTIWIGLESWPASALLVFDVLDAQPEDNRVQLGTSTPLLFPGTTLDVGDTLPGGGGNVGRVTYKITPDATRVEVCFE